MSDMDKDNQFAAFKATFFDECDELLESVEGHLADLSAGEQGDDTLHAIFRAVHTVKAGAAAFGFSDLSTYTHQFEDALDKARHGELAITEEVVDTLIQGSDVLAKLVEGAKNDFEIDRDEFDGALSRINAMAGGTAGAEETEAVSADSVKEEPAQSADQQIGYLIKFTPKKELLRNANDPILLLRDLGELGTVRTVANLESLPSLQELDPEDSFLSWTVEYIGTATIDQIEEVFEFALDDCILSFEPLEQGADHKAYGIFAEEDAARARIEAGFEDEDGAFGLFTDDEPIVEAPKSDPEPPKPAIAPSASSKQGQTSSHAAGAAGEPTQKTAAQGSIRVELDRVDRLVNMVGELVITQAMLAERSLAALGENNPSVMQGLDELAAHTRELQESVMAIRMQPVKAVFSRLPRIVRDLSAKLDKKCKLVTVGENTEVDKTVIQELADPLTHMIRNSVDHGLEKPADRIAAGKPEQGTITLSAEHRGGRIVIEIEDDGAGINRERVLEKAIEKGIVPANATLSPEEIENLLFAPGFSTAEKVTDVSGRGVGMDVVRRNIAALGGKISVSSEPGQGTRFTMVLPLTLAVLDGMIVAVGTERYVIPLTAIIESIRPRRDDLHSLVNGARVMKVRGDYVRMVFLGEAFDIDNSCTDPTRGLVVLVETDDGGRVGIVVDELLGQQQVVIKSLEENFDPIEGISAATILGNGQVCLILDVDELNAMERRESTLKKHEALALTHRPGKSVSVNAAKVKGGQIADVPSLEH